MGMRVNSGSGIDPQLVDKLVEMEKLPIKAIETRKKGITEEQKVFKELQGMVSALGSAVSGMRNRSDFYKIKAESSHPDILDATVDNKAPVGSYELEVRQLARTHKLLAEGFPDKNETSVGFGYMSIELDDGTVFDVDIDPDQSTLQDVSRQINGMNMGARAIVINTKEYLETGEDSYRLLVLSTKSGKEAKIYIDPDTSDLEFREQVTGRNLEMYFEDVPIFDEDNNVEELMDGLVIQCKRAEPGTKVTLKIDYDLDATLEGIKKWVDTYNKVNDFIDKQFQIDPNSNKAGVLAKDNSLRTLRRSLQAPIQNQLPSGRFRNLAELGIISDAKTGTLKIDDTKVKKALADDYVSVANLFVVSDVGNGVAAAMSDAVRGVQAMDGGVIASKDREYKRLLKGFDDDIERKDRLAGQRAESIKRRFAALDQLVSGLNSQGQYLQQRLGGSGGG